jgi:lipoprotein-anchoring transpeptidase ErfK/SrfK
MHAAAAKIVCCIVLSGAAGLCSAPTNHSHAVSRDILDTVELQAALVRDGISPGPIDGLTGPQTEAALRAFQQKHALRTTGVLDDATRIKLPVVAPVLTNYIVTSNDISRLLPLATTWLGKSLAPRLDYENVLELVGEKSQSHHKLLQALNPAINWTNVTNGTVVTVPNAQFPTTPSKAAFVHIRLGDRILQAFGSDSNLLAHFPCSIGQRVDKRPVGELYVAVLAANPNYTFDPEVFPESSEAQEIGRKLTLQPGPNNPVGTVWIGLDRPGYGIHGTPLPEKVGRTESHGCFRLANWNAEYLLKLVSLGTPVIVAP